MTLANNINPNKLHDELIKAGIIPKSVLNDLLPGKYIAKNTWLEFEDDADMGLIQQIIDSHNPTPLPEPLSEIDKLKLSQAEQFEFILKTLEEMI